MLSKCWISSVLIDLMSYIHRWHFNTSNSFDLSGHAKALENGMLQRLQAEMLDPNSPLFLLPIPQPSRNRNPRLPGGRKAKGKSKPKPKVKAKAKSGNKRPRENDDEADQGGDDEATESEQEDEDANEDDYEAVWDPLHE